MFPCFRLFEPSRLAPLVKELDADVVTQATADMPALVRMDLKNYLHNLDNPTNALTEGSKSAASELLHIARTNREERKQQKLCDVIANKKTPGNVVGVHNKDSAVNEADQARDNFAYQQQMTLVEEATLEEETAL